MPKVKYGNVVLCEYVAQGSNNKPILINVFSGDIVVATVPADLSFGLFVELSRDQAIDILSLDMNFDQKMVVRAEMLVGPNLTAGGALVVPQFPVRIERDGIFEVRASAKGFTSTVILSKRIFQGKVPGASAPTASARPS